MGAIIAVVAYLELATFHVGYLGQPPGVLSVNRYVAPDLRVMARPGSGYHELWIETPRGCEGGDLLLGKGHLGVDVGGELG